MYLPVLKHLQFKFKHLKDVGMYLAASVYLCCILLVVHQVLRAHWFAGGTPVKMELGCRVIVRQAGYVHLRRQG